MSNEDDRLFSFEKAFNESRKRLDAMRALSKRLNKGFEPKSFRKNISAMTLEEMLQNSRNNIDKLKELSKKLNRL